MPDLEFAADLAAVARIKSIPTILRMMRELTGMRVATVARVTDHRWIACAVDDGLESGICPGYEIPIESTICHEIRQHREPVLFTHASEDPVYSTHHIPKNHQLESYVSIPIVLSNGDFFGTLCALDRVPAELDADKVLTSFTLFAELIATSLDMQRALTTSENELAGANEAVRLQNEFVAVLSHDLRTPLSAIQMSAQLLEKKVSDRQERRFASTILKSTRRMGALIEDVLDFARGRLGGGIPVNRAKVSDLQALLQGVISEIRISHPSVLIEQSLVIKGDVYCDPSRIGQLLANLLTNAVTHGAKDQAVNVNVLRDGECIRVEVHNYGSPISPELMPLLFQPFTRSAVGSRAEGLGLGLYIAAQIVSAHKGTLTVSSAEDEGTRFVAKFPSRPLD
ncbi:GAF domain-containing sensor histidine kinase [Pseudomonas sp. Marseille-QA0892]